METQWDLVFRGLEVEVLDALYVLEIEIFGGVPNADDLGMLGASTSNHIDRVVIARLVHLREVLQDHRVPLAVGESPRAVGPGRVPQREGLLLELAVDLVLLVDDIEEVVAHVHGVDPERLEFLLGDLGGLGFGGVYLLYLVYNLADLQALLVAYAVLSRDLRGAFSLELVENSPLQ